ncbi:MAG TPA: twin-arginine translocase subunit TatC [Tepidisphaeraceae bacterium]
MSSAPSINVNAPTPPPTGYNPEEYRMTIGEHLEELRKRLFWGVGGFAIVFFVFMIPSIGEEVVRIACRPLQIALARNGLPPNLISTDPAEPFMTFIKAAMISAATVAGPWLIYQLWLFIAAGLYPHERKYVTKYLPLSITLFVVGVVFLYFYVLPLMLEFFLGFQLGAVMPLGDVMNVHPTATTQPVVIPIIPTDPANPVPGSLWINAKTGLCNICIAQGTIRVLPFGSGKLINPMITLSTYFDMVIGLLLAFGLAFQLPLVVLALVRIGILEIATLKKMRRIVYFVLTVIAAVIVPDVVTGMIALMLPLILLYEFGILLAAWGQKKADAAAGT